MDVSGQSMLPMAALGALMMPGTVFKVLAGIMLVISVAIIGMRWSTRHDRARIYAAKPADAGVKAHRDI